MCHGQKSRFFGDGKNPTFNRNPYNGYINPYYWVDDHPLLCGNNGSLDPSTHDFHPETNMTSPLKMDGWFRWSFPILLGKKRPIWQVWTLSFREASSSQLSYKHISGILLLDTQDAKKGMGRWWDKLVQTIEDLGLDDMIHKNSK